MDLKKKFTKVKSKRTEIESAMEDLFVLTQPERLFKTTAMIDDRSQIFDTTAVASANTLTTSVLANFVPIGKEWVKFSQSQTSKELIGKSNEIEAALQEQTNIFFNQINKSNFYLAMADAIETLIMTGSANILLEWDEDDDALVLSVPAWHEVYLNEGPNRKVCEQFKMTSMTAQNIKTRWPDLEFGREFEDKLEKDPDYIFEIIEVFNKTPAWEDEENPYCYSVWMKKGWKELDEKKTRKPRIVTGRWKLNNNSPYGIGPAQIARPDIISINRLVEMFLDGSEFRAAPPIFTQDSRLSDKQMRPGTFVLTDDINARAFQFSDVGAIQSDIQAMQAQIKRTFHDATLPPLDQSKGMTAFEVSVRQNQFFTSLGHTAVTLEEEILKPLVSAIVALLQDVGVMQKFAFGEAEDVDLEFFSIVRASKEAESVQKDLQALQMISNFGPERVQSIIDLNGLSRSILERMDFSADFIKSEEEQEQEELNKAQQQQAMALTQSLNPGNNASQDVMEKMLNVLPK